LASRNLLLLALMVSLSGCRKPDEAVKGEATSSQVSSPKRAARQERAGRAERPHHPAPGDSPPGDPRRKWVEVQVEPPQRHTFATMKVGARQHVDRDYTYDVVPAELTGGLLYQGIHRPPRGLRVTLALQKPARVYFFFHDRYDGGYTQIFSQMTNWERRPKAPQYDLAGGAHGKSMLLFAADLQAGTHVIPSTTKSRACFSIVFDFGAPAGELSP
jgi:hypothetical protein